MQLYLSRHRVSHHPASMDARVIAEALGLRRNGKSWRGPCPVCGGSDRSTKFAISDGEKSVVAKCFAGCDQDTIVHELKSRNLWPESRLTPQKKRIVAKERTRAEIESALSHELVVLGLIVGQRVADRQLARDKGFRQQRPEWRPLPDEHWEREILAVKRIKTALEALYHDY